MSTHRLQALLDQSAALHDHLCPRQVLGVRMGMLAAELLGLELPQSDKRLLTFVETDGCFADGVAVATGCWLGHRTLRLVDHGKIAATFIDTATNHAIRVHPSEDSRRLAARHVPHAANRWHAYLEGYQSMPAGELLVAHSVTLNRPVESLVSRHDHRAICSNCGEEIFNEREVTVGSRVLCKSCAGQPYLLPLVDIVDRSNGG